MKRNDTSDNWLNDLIDRCFDLLNPRDGEPTVSIEVIESELPMINIDYGQSS